MASSPSITIHFDILIHQNGHAAFEAIASSIKDAKSEALWYKILELRFLLQKPFSSSNRLPQDPVKSSFCEADENVRVSYSDLIASSKETLDSILEL
ncbi:hypothetical protein HN51_069938 [Arachis hypogaea]